MKNALKLLGLIAMVAVMGLVMVGCGNNCVADGNCGIRLDMPAALDPTDDEAVMVWLFSQMPELLAAEARQCATASCNAHIDAAAEAWEAALDAGQRANLNVSCNC